MFNLFGTKKKVVNGVRKYPAVVEAIHNEFNISGEKLLSEAKEIISGLHVNNKVKADQLRSLGFANTKEVLESEIVLHQKREKEKLANALEFFSVNYPSYKFITKQMAMTICKKYNLVLGEVSQYKGFVPQKNIDKIKDFFKEENDLNTVFYKSHSGYHHSFVSKKDYDIAREAEKNRRSTERDYPTRSYDSVYLSSSRNSLSIAAPLKDMETKGFKLKDRIFSREVPDPVVLAPVSREGVELYCIVTAWGDEASDEIVVNQQMN